jgi:acetylornithine deacetylase/succinyl-diaminopimelate desuccinylase-like protein
MNPSDVRSSFETDRERILAEWQELLSFPSISTEPNHHQDCLDCANWLKAHLEAIGFESRLLETPTKPVVFGEYKGPPDSPVVLFYGHYDVQPVDPLEEWESPPFTPTLVDGRMRARGAEDNKGQHFYALKAMQALIREKALNVTVKVVIEGEEESGSTGIAAMLPEWQDMMRADVLMVTDIFMESLDQPTITLGLRGIISLTVELMGPKHDLHSGVHGGVAPNPAAAMARLLTSLHDEHGAIAVDGYYDDVLPPTSKETKLAADVPFDGAAYEKLTGIAPVMGEPNLAPIERLAFRPSIDINGLHSGFDGPGSKTIIPAKAIAKITSRLAAGQDPERALGSIADHLHAHSPPGMQLTISEQCAAGAGFRLDPESDYVLKAAEVLNRMFGIDPVLRWEGASIPIIADLSRLSGAEPLLIGFGLEEDRIHAPNESFSLDQFRLGYEYVALMLSSM